MTSREKKIEEDYWIKLRELYELEGGGWSSVLR
jgi:hypothetical protein